ncbi:glucosaminidase domain-containing protein [Loigolactobacillus iwatensis]|uniref:glucosaminidase domain-containing protein n=1 Tax=Loigolactobacillus iwatensis TaxID=1267156 RepID=UPI000F7E7704|nr:glucosaminidase domain-containing protein [Loigolactobacillus iwatensis]
MLTVKLGQQILLKQLTILSTTGILLSSTNCLFNLKSVQAASSTTITKNQSQTDTQTRQQAAQKDVLAAAPRGTSLVSTDGNDQTYFNEYWQDQTDYLKGKKAADSDVTLAKQINTSKPTTATPYFIKAYEVEFSLAQALYNKGKRIGYSAGYQQKEKDAVVVAQFGPVYQTGYLLGYQRGQTNYQNELTQKNKHVTDKKQITTGKEDSKTTAPTNSAPSNSSIGSKPVTSDVDHPQSVNEATAGQEEPVSQQDSIVTKSNQATTPILGAKPDFPTVVTATSNATIEEKVLRQPGIVVPSHKAFIKLFSKNAQKIAYKHGIYASVMIAQAALESSWGNSGLATAPNYNLFGVKGSFAGQSALMATKEDNGFGQLFTIKTNFKRYDSYKASLTDYTNLLTTGTTANFYAGTWKQNTKNYQQATRFLTGRYATDTKYNLKLNQIIATYHLTKYDQKTKQTRQINFVKKNYKKQTKPLATAYFQRKQHKVGPIFYL